MNDVICNMDALEGIRQLPDASVDLVIADPPYGLGKDYGNDSDKKPTQQFLKWTEEWLSLVIPKIKETGSLYIFATWRYSPEIFVFLKTKMIMMNEIIWDRKVPSMGGSTRRFSSVHDTIGFFTKSEKHYFDIDSIRIPYDAETKKARSRSIFVGKKWLEVGYNPKDLWSVSRLHRIHSEREDHPTQKPVEIVERMIRASCPQEGLVLDPFAGSGTTVDACLRNGRHYVAFEINPTYYEIIVRRRDRVAAELKSVLPLAAKSNDNKNINSAHKKTVTKDITLFENEASLAAS